jgi:iron uptake system component EfeO
MALLPLRVGAVLVLPIALALGAAACSSDSTTATSAASGSTASSSPEVQAIAVNLTEAGCEPRQISAKAGPTTLTVTKDDDGGLVTELEIVQDGTTVVEVEGVKPGDSKDVSVTLKEGRYDVLCPGGSAYDKGTLEVAAGSAAADSAEATKAVDTYLSYVKAEADQLVSAVAPFAAAVKDGDVAAAKASFAKARYHYEAIEPIAESFGDLDPQIDAREGDVPDAGWGGFHKIEQALFVDGDVSAMGTVADKLVTDVADLRTQIDTVELEPAQIANGAVELLNEVSVSKVTGEEDRYSHTDLSDFAGNLAGSKAAFDAVAPLLGAKDAALTVNITTQFDDVKKALDVHADATNPIGNGYVLYDTLTPEQTKALSAVLDPLADSMSQVAAQLL